MEGVVGLVSKSPPKGKLSGVNQLLAATRLNMHGVLNVVATACWTLLDSAAGTPNQL